MSHLTFIRHAETDLAGSFCGHSDPPINASGQIQVAALAARFSMGQFDFICCSDLQRAVDTAIPIAEALKLPLRKTPNLREIDFGDWESLTWNEIEKRDPDYAFRWMHSFPSLPAPGGETYVAFEHRVLLQVNNLLNMDNVSRAIVVTHGGAMRIVLHALLGYSEQAAYEATKAYCSSFEYEAPNVSNTVD
jgi:broad specificity phosphatase PhoE